MPLSITNTFTSGATAIASQVNTNFSDVSTYVNTNAIVKDASVAFTQVPSGPATDPSSANHLTRKLWVDRQVGSAIGQETDGTFSGITVFDTYYNVGQMDLAVPSGKPIFVDATGSFLALNYNGVTAFWAQMAVSLNNGSTWVYGPQLAIASPGGVSAGGTPRIMVSGTPTVALVKVYLRVQQRASLSTFADIFEPTVYATASPAAGLTL